MAKDNHYIDYDSNTISGTTIEYTTAATANNIYTWHASNSDTFYTNNLKLKELLQELANTPLLKIPFWIEGHREELKALGIFLKEQKLK